ncbi:MAG: metallopeptidase TldD-related protein, partial [bacterium]|nr:metallopeptidase TldD-related protein [bacterium]
MDKEYFSVKTNEFCASIANSAIESVRSRKLKRSSVRVFDSGFLGISSSKSSESVEDLERNALKSLELKVKADFSLPKGEKRNWDVSGFRITDEELLGYTNQILEKLSSKNPDFIFSGSSRNFSIEEHLENSLGADYGVRSSNTSFDMMFKHRESLSILDGAFANTYYSKPNIDEFVERFTLHLEGFKNTVSVEEESVPVIFWQDPTIMSFFAKHLNGELIELRSSYFSSKMGKRVFSEKFSLYDINYDPEHHIANPFDGDGFVREKHVLPLIEDG